MHELDRALDPSSTLFLRLTMPGFPDLLRRSTQLAGFVASLRQLFRAIHRPEAIVGSERLTLWLCFSAFSCPQYDASRLLSREASFQPVRDSGESAAS